MRFFVFLIALLSNEHINSSDYVSSRGFISVSEGVRLRKQELNQRHFEEFKFILKTQNQPVALPSLELYDSESSESSSSASSSYCEKLNSFLSRLKKDHVNIDDLEDNDGIGCVHYACQILDLKAIKALNSFGANLNIPTKKYNFYPFKFVLSSPNFQKRKIEIIRYLMNNGAINILDQQDKMGFTALHYACQYNHPQIVQFLLHHGADPDIRTYMGNLPSDYTTNPKIQYVINNTIKLNGQSANLNQRIKYQYDRHFWKPFKDLSKSAPQAETITIYHPTAHAS